MHIAIEPKILYFGTPVVLISTLNEDGSANLAPMSSAWALGWNIALGLGNSGKTIENLRRTVECALNFPSADMWQAVEQKAPLTGKDPVPPAKVEQFRYERDKFAAAGLTPVPAECIAPPRVLECPLQFEAKVNAIRPLGDTDSGTSIVEVSVVRVHADSEIVTGMNYINPLAWHPLIYSFRHYYGLGVEVGKTFRAEI